MFSPTSKSSRKIAALFDIGTGSIGCALIKTSPRGSTAKPEIVWSYHESMPLQGEIDSAKLLQVMQRHLKSVASHVSKEGAQALAAHHDGSPVEATCVLSSPWYLSHSKKVVIDKQRPFPVTARLINDILAEEEAQFEKASQDTSYGHIFKDTVAIERKVIETKLNGYRVQNPQGKMVRCLEVELFTSIVSKSLLQAIEEVINRALHFNKVSFSSSVLASFSVVRDIYSSEESFLLFDVSAELTELSAIRHGILQNTLSFPLGTNSLIRSLSASLKTTHEVAASLVQLYATKSTESETTKRVGDAMSHFERDWCGYLRKSFTEISKEIALPNKIYILAPNEYSAFFAQAIEKEKCIELPSGSLEDGTDLSVVALDEKKLGEFVEVGNTPVTTPIIIDTLFFSKLFSL